MENCSRVEVISTLTESQCNLGRQTTEKQTYIQYTETAGPTDRRSEKRRRRENYGAIMLKFGI